MNKIGMNKTVKTINIYDSSIGEGDNSQYGTYSSLKTPGKIRKRIILGQKFDYGEKAKEKQNYVYFVAGQGQEKTEIEEMEQIRGKPKKEERIVEEKEIIDNYQYHETKDIRKKHQKDSQTHHQRLCSPFERTKIRKYASYTTEPIQSGYKIIKKTDLVNKNDYQLDNLKYNKYNPLTQNVPKIKDENINPNIYETYKPLINYNPSKVTNTISTTHRDTSFGKKISIISNSKRNTKVNGHKNICHIQMNYKEPEEKFSPQQVINYEFQEQTIKNQPSYSHISIEERNTETKKTVQYPIPTQRLKFGSLSKNEKKTLDEGPKYQYKAKNKPKLVKSQRTRSVQRIKHITKEKKGYIPFAGHGVRVGQGPLGGQIPRPIPSPVTKQEEEVNVSERHEKKTSITNITKTAQTTHTQHNSRQNSKSNIRSINDIKQGSIQENKSYSHFSSMSNIKNNDSIKFPGKGVRVGSSSLTEIGLTSDLVSGTSYSEYTKYEETVKQTEVNEKMKEECHSNNIEKKTNEKCNEETFSYNAEEEKKEKCNEGAFCYNAEEEKKEKCNEESICFKGEEEKKEKCNEQSICFSGEEKDISKCKEEHICHQCDHKEENEKCNEESICYKGKQVGNVKCNIERLCYRGDLNILYREVLCPVHGRRLVKISKD
jgi:hypothetical protein